MQQVNLVVNPFLLSSLCQLTLVALVVCRRLQTACVLRPGVRCQSATFSARSNSSFIYVHKYILCILILMPHNIALIFVIKTDSVKKTSKLFPVNLPNISVRQRANNTIVYLYCKWKIFTFFL